ncbi:MAG: hypothetical protein K0V04_21585, partial [Deltaproteobacteria bacterium]|nr:hypothetical protein [Deltaproteobacteria bacterium]
MNKQLLSFSALCAAALLSVALTPASAEAATLTVCSSGCNYTDLNDAVDLSSAGDVLELGNETFVGGLDITHALTIRAMGAGMPTIDGGSWNNVVRVRPGVSVTLESVEITGGLVKSGIKNSGDLVLDHVYVVWNDCVYGGLWNAPSGVLTVTGNSVFADNSSSSFFAGGLNNIGGDVAIDTTTFIGN